MKLSDKLNSYEQEYKQSLKQVAKHVSADKNILFVLITGASCAGKTTTTRLLARNFEKHGVHAEVISLDDFYKNRSDAPLDKDGNPDLETVYSLDLDLLHDTLASLAKGLEVKIPIFDFLTQCRSEEYNTVSLDKGEVMLIEGLHALNPLIYRSFIPEKMVYKVYLYAENEKYDVKLLRRLVRDSYYRNSNAKMTLDMWTSVRTGEETYIKPFRDGADICINTYNPYEPGLLAARGLEVLRALPENCVHGKIAAELMSMLEHHEQMPYESVPDGSLMWEFIKK